MRKKQILFIVLVVMVLSYWNVGFGQQVEQYHDKPPLRVGKIFSEFLIGELCAVMSGFTCAFLLAQLTETNGLGAVYTGLVGGVIGITIGSAFGVYQAGSNDIETGSFFATLGGSIIGTVVALYPLFQQSNIDQINPFLLLTSPTIGAIIGFNCTNKYRSYSIFNYYHKKLHLSFPLLLSYYNKNSSNISFKVNIISINL